MIHSEALLLMGGCGQQQSLDNAHFVCSYPRETVLLELWECCSRSAKFCASATTQTLVWRLFHKLLGFLGGN